MADELYHKSETANDAQRVSGLEQFASSPTPAESARLRAPQFLSNLTPTQRYIGTLAATFVTIFMAAWIWSNYGRMWFLDTEYTTWLAKTNMVENCALGDTAIIGDSQPMAGIIPGFIDKGATNLARGGASPIETYYQVRNILKCPKPPRRLLVSFSPGTMIWAEFYWNRAVFFRNLSFDEMEEVRSVSEKIDDDQLYPRKFLPNVRGFVKNLSYEVSVPFHYAPAMLNAGVFTRRQDNIKQYDATLQAAGQRYAGTGASALWPSPAADFARFNPGRLQDYYFNRMLSALAERKIEVYYSAMPESELTSRKMPPAVAAEYSDYLRSLSQRHSNFHVLIEPFTFLPATYFGDSEHLNENGARYWSRIVADRLAEADASKGQSSRASTGQQDGN